jgi:hypothetical protein
MGFVDSYFYFVDNIFFNVFSFFFHILHFIDNYFKLFWIINEKVTMIIMIIVL